MCRAMRFVENACLKLRSELIASRFVSLQEEYDEEIPIHIGHVPRYVSGINRKTTCNDVIKGNERGKLKFINVTFATRV